MRKMERERRNEKIGKRKEIEEEEISTFHYLYFFKILTTVKSSKEKKIKTVIKQTEKIYNTRYPCYILRLKMRKNSEGNN